MATFCHQEGMKVGDEVSPEEAFRELTELNLSCNLRVFGSQLGLEASFLDDIESRSFDERLRCILAKSNDRELLTWTKLVNTLMQPSLDERRVVRKLLDPERASASSIRSSRSTSLGESLSLEDRGKLLNTICLVSGKYRVL